MKNLATISIIAVAAVISGCGYIQSLFPDKEKDYQYTTEIPMLNWPAELRSNQANVTQNSLSENREESAGTANSSESSANAVENTSGENSQSTETPSDDKGNQTEVSPNSEAEEKETVSSVEIVKYDDGESRLRIGSGISKAWREVSKALSRNSIEVTERNRESGQFAVQYDPDETKLKDGSFMDEISFLFHGINAHEKAYFLKLEEHDQQTDVIVSNVEGAHLVNDDAGLRLLKVLSDTIKTNLAEKK